MGNDILKDFRKFGVNTKYLLVRQGQRSKFVFILTKPNIKDSQRIHFKPKPSARVLTNSEWNEMKCGLPTPKVVHFASVNKKIIELAKLGGKVVYHAKSFDNRFDIAELIIEELMSQIHLLVTPERIAKRMLRYLDPPSGRDLASQLQILLDIFLDRFPLLEIAIITRGAEGLLAIRRDNPGILNLPAYSVNVKDPTGAGDVFSGALLFKLIQQGWHQEQKKETKMPKKRKNSRKNKRKKMKEKNKHQVIGQKKNQSREQEVEQSCMLVEEYGDKFDEDMMDREDASLKLGELPAEHAKGGDSLLVTSTEVEEHSPTIVSAQREEELPQWIRPSTTQQFVEGTFEGLPPWIRPSTIQQFVEETFKVRITNEADLRLIIEELLKQLTIEELLSMLRYRKQ